MAAILPFLLAYRTMIPFRFGAENSWSQKAGWATVPLPLKCLCPNPWKTNTLPYMAERTLQMWLRLQNLRWDNVGGPNLTWAFKSGESLPTGVGDAMEKEAGDIQSTRGTRPAGCWLWRWRKGSTGQGMYMASRSWKQPLPASQQGNKDLHPTATRNWTLPTIWMGKKTGSLQKGMKPCWYLNLASETQVWLLTYRTVR